MNKNCAVVLGGYVNGYSIIQELHECGIQDIVLLVHKRNLSTRSNRIKTFYIIDRDSKSLESQLHTLHKQYNYLVLFPTNDLHVESMCEIYDKVSDFCFLPVHKENSLKYQSKLQQYRECERLKLPYPKTIFIQKPDDLNKLDSFLWPIIIKPTTRKDITTSVFRSLIINGQKDYNRNLQKLAGYIEQGIEFLASEIIPGDGSNIYAYVGYRNKQGEILNEWTGKKLSQYPNDFGVFSSASNQAPIEVMEQGRTLLNELNLYGIIEPEFKYDNRDNKYKLMEINLRSMMWHRTGNRSGVHIQYTQWLDALGKAVSAERQEKDRLVHFVYYKHELINLLTRAGYWKTFKHNFAAADQTTYAVYDREDIKPFLYDLSSIARGLGIQCLKKLGFR